MEGHSSLFNCHCTKYLKIILGLLSKPAAYFQYYLNLGIFFETGIWCQIRVKTDKFVNTIFKQGTNTKLVACYLNEL